jgi:hypothetical protein
MEMYQEESSHRLVVQIRIPDEFSAGSDEHEWKDTDRHVNVGGLTIGQGMTEAKRLLSKVPDRPDEEYRVVLVETQITRWVL